MTFWNNEQTKRGIELFFLSLAALFIELLVIRWMCSDFRSIAVLRSFPLVACFVGLGVGFALGHDRWYKFAPLALFGTVLMIVVADLLGMSQYPYPTMAIYQWGQLNNLSAAMWVWVAIFMLWLGVVLAFPFATLALIGSRLGVLFNSMTPLRAYAIDIAGAILGSILFTALSFLCWSPGAQLAIPCIVIILCNRKLLSSVLPSVVALALAIAPWPTNNGTVWTPYFKLQVRPVEYHEGDKLKVAGWIIKVNQMFQQYFFIDPSMTPMAAEDESVARLMEIRRLYYDVPYNLIKPKHVLVLGAGTGSDVREAVRHGASSVDAVEIDPVVLKFGKENNPTYSDPRVHLICADARNYLHHCGKKYDLIVVACLDSLAVTGMGSSVRIDSYVHTRESITRMLGLLNHDGILVMSFGAGGGHWLRDRLFNTIRQAATYDPIYLTDEGQKISWPAFVYVAGLPVKEGTLKADQVEGYQRQSIDVPSTTKILTDDWPYLYVSPTVIDLPYLLLIAEVFLLSVFAARNLLFKKSDFRNWQMLFLGSGFLLVELQAISRLSLLFGATWLTSAAVINGVLIMILIANWLVLRFRQFTEKFLLLVYLGLFASIGTNYLLPINEMVNNPSAGLAEPILITALTLFPVILAGIIFSTSFSRVKVAGTALGFNLLGSVLGGLLELLSPYTGVRGLLLIALILYASSCVCWFTASRQKTLDQ